MDRTTREGIVWVTGALDCFGIKLDDTVYLFEEEGRNPCLIFDEVVLEELDNRLYPYFCTKEEAKASVQREIDAQIADLEAQIKALRDYKIKCKVLKSEKARVELFWDQDGYREYKYCKRNNL